MKNELTELLQQTIASLVEKEVLPENSIDVYVERCRDRQHGDFASNAALLLAKPAKRAPRDIAADIIAALPESDLIKNTNIAGPGFINFHLNEAASQNIVSKVLQEKENFGRCTPETNQSFHLEFVSANPTGPLHVGHGRGAAFGSSLANLLDFAGISIHREYYVNDAGRQMNILAVSVWFRYLHLFQVTDKFPSNGYKGDYVQAIAEQLKNEYGDRFVIDIDELFADVTPDGEDSADEHIDDLIKNAYQLLASDYRLIHSFGLNDILDDIRDDLAEFGVTFDTWFSEQKLEDSGQVARAIEKLRHAGFIYEKDGAQWFNAIHFGDEKDRVLIRANGQKTYFASDIAYHMDKFERGYNRVIDILGADHHGYVTRVKAAISAMEGDAEKFSAFLVQFAILYRGKERVQMSTRSGSFVTLRELRQEVGNDAARFFYVMRKPEQHLDFDLDLAKSQSSDNPVYYIQYAHARIKSVFRQLGESMAYSEELGLSHLALLTNEHEKVLLAKINQFPEHIEQCAKNFEPHAVAQYLRDLANAFHTYYNAHQFLVDDENLRNARLSLINATGQVIRNGLKILGVSAPDEM